MQKRCITVLIEGSKGDTTQLWKIINNLLRKNNTKEFSKVYEGADDLVTNDKDIAHCFNDYFSSVAKNLADNLPAGKSSPLEYMDSNVINSFVLFPTDVHEVTAVILKLKSGKSSGYDNVSNDIQRRI